VIKSKNPGSPSGNISELVFQQCGARRWVFQTEWFEHTKGDQAIKTPMTPTPDAETQLMLDSLRLAVAKTLERKRRLGHYVIKWSGGKAIAEGEDAPADLLAGH